MNNAMSSYKLTVEWYFFYLKGFVFKNKHIDLKIPLLEILPNRSSLAALLICKAFRFVRKSTISISAI